MFEGNELIPVTNRSADLADCRENWFYDEAYDCWCLQDILYTEKATVPQFQRLSVYAPQAYMNPDGTPDPHGRSAGYTCATAPVVFVNNAAGYMQMPHTWLGGPRCSPGRGRKSRRKIPRDPCGPEDRRPLPAA